MGNFTFLYFMELSDGRISPAYGQDCWLKTACGPLRMLSSWAAAIMVAHEGKKFERKRKGSVCESLTAKNVWHHGIVSREKKIQ